jgi:hypothetical protein
MFPALRPLLAAAIHHELDPRFSKEELARIVHAAADDHAAAQPQLPHDTGGARVMLHLAALSIGLYRALLARVDEATARRYTANVTWRLVRSMMAIPTAVAALTAPPGPERLRRATDLVRRYPLGPPAYQVVDVEGADCAVAFDVLRCPVADYFASQGLADLCCEVFCELDHRLAAEWGVELERSGTLAGGKDRCDFRWRVT